MTLTTLLGLIADPERPKLPESPLFWMPRDASITSRNVDWVWDFMVWMSVLCAIGIFVVMFYFVWRFRAKSRAANELAEASSEHNTTLEITWSVIPLVICIALFVWGFRGYVDLRTPPKDALEIHATGQKWKWSFDHTCPSGDKLSEDKLHAPIDTPVRVIISSMDVLHALFIPNFRTKMDAVPGRYTDLWFQATEAGNFPIFCAEYCGTAHSDMLTSVVVHPPGEYEKWLQEECGKADDKVGAPRGEMLYTKKGCDVCHSIDGSTKIGPSWKGLFGKTQSFVSGPPVQVDENYLRESILDPQAKIVQGFTPAMPPFQGQLSDRDLTGLIEYIKTLK
jgi:cytochrome c oxidase subunit 2